MNTQAEQPADAEVLTVVPAEPAPLPEERLASLDLVRGITILGILPVNMAFYMAAGEGFAPPESLLQGWGDHVAAVVILFVFTGKMITQLALLFGAGLAIQSLRADAAGRPFVGYYLWRMALLFLIGLAHALLLWYGDILTSYALVGAAALLFRRLGRRGLFWWAVGLFTWFYLAFLGFAVLIMLAPSAMTGFGSEAGEGSLDTYLSPQNETRIYQQGPWTDMVINRALHLGLYLVFFFAIWWAWNLLACFLVGMAFLRRGVFHDVEGHRPFLRRLVGFGLGVGVPLHVAAVGLYAWDPRHPLPALLAMAGALPQALGYLGLALFWSHSGRAAWLQARLRAVGRLALTNYLLQSVICGLLFYSYGLGLFGTLGLSAGLAVAAAIWVLELAWSPVWLRYFAMGPLEWLWRSLADRRLRPFRRAA